MFAMTKEKQEKQKKPVWEKVLAVVLFLIVFGIGVYTANYIDKEARSGAAEERKQERQVGTFFKNVSMGSVYGLNAEGNTINSITINDTTYNPTTITIEGYPEYIDKERATENIFPHQVHYETKLSNTIMTIYYDGTITEFIKQFSTK